MMKTTNLLCVFIITSLSNCDVCRFDKRRKWSFCHERRLERLPDDIIKTSEKLLLQNNFIKKVDEEKLLDFENLKEINLNGNLLTRVPCLPSNLEVAEFSKNRIKEFSICMSLKSLRFLDLSVNNLTSASLYDGIFERFERLKHLSLESNSLDRIPTKMPGSIAFLNLKNNKIHTILNDSFLNLRNLQVLILESNEICNIENHPFSQLNSLNMLNLNNNLIIEVPTKLPASLNKLLLSRNKIRYLYKNANKFHGSIKHKLQVMRVNAQDVI